MAFLLAVGSVACSSDDSADGDNTPVKASNGLGSDQEKCVDIINQYRAKKGLPPFARWTDQETCSNGEAESDAKSGKGHGSFPRCGEMAQNECPNFGGSITDGLPKCLAAMWAEGPGGGHYENMASTKFTKVACGVYAVSSDKFWSVQNFR